MMAFENNLYMSVSLFQDPQDLTYYLQLWWAGQKDEVCVAEQASSGAPPVMSCLELITSSLDVIEVNFLFSIQSR